MSSEFPRAEYEARWRRAREALAAAGLDALLVTSEGFEPGMVLTAELLTEPSPAELRVIA